VHASPDLFVDVIIPCAMEMSACDSADCKATVLRIAGDSLSFLLNDLGDAAKDMLLQAASPASKIYTLVTRDVLPRVRALLADKEQVTLNSLRLLAKLVTDNRNMPFPRCLYDLHFCPLILPLLTPGNAVCCTHLFAVVRQPLCPPPHLRLTRGTGARHRGVPGHRPSVRPPPTPLPPLSRTIRRPITFSTDSPKQLPEPARLSHPNRVRALLERAGVAARRHGPLARRRRRAAVLVRQGVR
jgi:hypothetical protein